jgi:hypothetical protein
LQVGQYSPLIVVELALAEIAKVLSLLIVDSSKEQTNVRAIQPRRTHIIAVLAADPAQSTARQKRVFLSSCQDPDSLRGSVLWTLDVAILR